MRASGRKRKGFHTATRQHRPKRCAELRIAIVKNIAAWLKVAPRLLGRATGDLLHPLLIRMSGNTGHSDATAPQVNEEQNVVGNQSSPCEHFHGEEVSTRQNIHARGDKVLPGGCSASLRSWRNPVTAQ